MDWSVPMESGYLTKSKLGLTLQRNPLVQICQATQPFRIKFYRARIEAGDDDVFRPQEGLDLFDGQGIIFRFRKSGEH